MAETVAGDGNDKVGHRKQVWAGTGGILARMQ
jgi:hypothetical protein